MAHPLFNRRHIREYIVYGGIAALLYAGSVWYYLSRARYADSWVVYIGTTMFMLVSIVHSLQLTTRRNEYKSVWKMLMAGHLAVLFGIAVTTLLCVLLCFIYIPGFMSGNSGDHFLANAPAGMNPDNTGTLIQIFVPATIGNFGAAAFMSLVASYVIKPNQTKDRPVPLQ